MSTPDRRWYAPVVKRWRGRPLTRGEAIWAGLYAAIGLGLFAGLVLPHAVDGGGLMAGLSWALVIAWSFEVYRLVAHAAFNARAAAAEREDGA